MPTDPILIVGAGIAGLVLGQALKQRNIPFKIYERDPSLHSRHQGWAITLHWALPYLSSLLPVEVLNRVEEAQVDSEVAKHDTGNFLFLNLQTGKTHWRIPPNKRWRVNRVKLRGALLAGIEEDIKWGARVEGMKIGEDGKPRVLYRRTDGVDVDNKELIISEPATLVVGAEGARSTVREFLCPENYINNHLPVRFTGVSLYLTEEEIAPLRALDPLLFQGCHPETGVYLWFSMLDTPRSGSPSTMQTEHPDVSETKRRKGSEDVYKVQLGLSWLVKDNLTDQVPNDNALRLANMKRRAKGFVPLLYETIQRIPDGTEVIEVTLADWEGQEWDNRGGKVTLAGDAAHAMTMYRGQAANHCIRDVYHLIDAIEKIHTGANAKSLVDAYETEMRERTHGEVHLSRRACIEAHEWESLGEGSAILARRAL